MPRTNMTTCAMSRDEQCIHEGVLLEHSDVLGGHGISCNASRPFTESKKSWGRRTVEALAMTLDSGMTKRQIDESEKDGLEA